MNTTKFPFNAVFFLALAIVIIAQSCVKKNDFPDEPVIQSITFNEATEALIVKFTDGDGDFGIPSNNPNFPDSVLENGMMVANPFYYNLWIDYFEKREGEWVLINLPSSNNFRLDIPEPTGQNKQLEVTITNDLSGELPFPTAQSDTIKFSIILVDRALHQSLPAETGPIYSPR